MLFKFVFCIVFIISLTKCSYFILGEGQKLCFVEEIAPDVQVAVMYKTQDATPSAGVPSLKGKITVTDSLGRYLSDNEFLREGRIAFTTTRGGEYTICFEGESSYWVRSSKKLKVYSNILIGVDAIDFDKLAKVEELTEIDISVRKTLAMTQNIKADFLYLKRREWHWRDTSEQTNSRVFFFTFLEIIVMISSVILQTFYLHKFFHRKKIL
eukprot:TRINITY_DN2894_c0_g2_i1.p1 TRINITY_DN2894_c0_g2~~TRINITY_DN2894_c0_g2_i1.p1  ORF type:complete len:211 (-),score=45.17 TRINITY_DN2894_c0_g2_i1:664-1296(-)